jgi:hypothetical protein
VGAAPGPGERARHDGRPHIRHGPGRRLLSRDPGRDAHFASGTIAFAALIAACYVLGRHYSQAGDRVSAIASRVAGTAALAGNLWAMTGGKAGSLTLAVGVIAAMLWVATVAARYLRSL